MNAIDFYHRIITEKNAEKTQLQKQIKTLATARLLLFVLIVVAGFYTSDFNLYLTLGTVVVGTFAFFFLVQLQFRKNHLLEDCNQLISVAEDEEKRAKGEYSHAEGGDEHKNPNHEYSGDLDIFGHASLFAYLNRCSTEHGKTLLAEWLQAPENWETILARQEAVKELSQKPDFRLAFRAKGEGFQESKQDIIQIQSWLESPVFFTSHKLVPLLKWVMPFFNAVVIVLSIAGLLPWQLAILSFLLMLGIVAAFGGAINETHAQISRKFKLFTKYAALAKMLEETHLESAYLKNEAQTGYQALAQLARLAQNMDYRLNMLAALFLNGFLLWDLHAASALEKWRTKHNVGFPQLVARLGKLDAICSFAAIAYNQPNFAYPTESKSAILDFEAMAHPLLPAESRVANSFYLAKKGDITLITGSNMAGKSTFLRTVAVNTVLALAGCVVCAERFSLQSIKLYTSMRVADSLKDNESSFYAELRRLKTLIDILSAGESRLIFLDEILKGTNSKDRNAGSEALVQQLVRLGATGFVTTHDLALGALADLHPQNIRNFNFEVRVEGDEFTYDYTIRKGICGTMNAMVLMQKMGITL
ncbi:MAG: hypothetical protein JJT94_15420 [Bernardetiaceae bacterium]|nr:hypothetical protein [Bernardetiaceae bacterium]